ncbi:3-oxoacyl-ACP synthase III family protein [Salinibacterium sp. PAMC 21357]|uniref:3-oxoacyl-ACP synthase III family protein n=1 Tax=Salinibacterium sp. PAMC 21357 TaxID=1112215 RepID=UPI000288E55E|nr:ketoacyl-ACP synthase III [Salinibacterium sp. PAMC 21357]
MNHVTARIASTGTYLPERIRTTAETEKQLRSQNPTVKLATGLIHRLTGVESVHLRPDGWQTSDLAVAAARTALEHSPGPIDLIIFSSASQDLIEPATSHIVAAKLEIDCPVMDVKNACNSVLNGMQVGAALIATGQYRRVLIASGETPSLGVRWDLDSHQQFIRSFPGYTMSDGGAAVILEAVELDPADDAPAGILDSLFVAASKNWSVGTLSIGGSMNPRNAELSYFDIDGAALQQAFLDLGPQPVHDILDRNGLTWDDIDLVAIHQVALPYLPAVFERLGVVEDKTVITVADHGNLASVTLPLQLEVARATGQVKPGSLVLMIGLAGGISLGLMLVRL